VVARGEVRIARKVAASEAGAEEGDEPEELAVLGAEAVFGEMALLTEAPRAASVHTTGRPSCWRRRRRRWRWR
jgi:CRP-like cAMP-binding protein